MKIAFTYNVKPKNIVAGTKDAEFYAEFDTPETIEGIKKAIEANGYEVIMIEGNEEAYEKLKKHRQEIDLVFNFAEAVTKSNDREAQMPMFCEILGIPYSGPRPLSAALILNKARAKEIWDYYDVPTAPFQVFYSVHDELNKNMDFPLIAKTNAEGSSSGVRNKSVVKNKEELYAVVEELLSEFKQPVLVEKFLTGREFTIPILGNGDKLEAMPIVEANFAALPEGVHQIDGYEAKWIWDNPENPIEAIICPVNITPELKKEIEETAKRAFTTIGCMDWGRVDLRLDDKGKLYVLEINCPVGLLPKPEDNSKLPRSAREAGLNFDQLLGKLIGIARERYGI